MKNLLKILIIVTLFLALGRSGDAQAVTRGDSLRIRAGKGQSNESVSGQKAEGNAFGQQTAGDAVNKNPSQGVKRIRGGRPDMTKARGARPPSVVRPSGSGIPKGLGRPGGVGRKGGR